MREVVGTERGFSDGFTGVDGGVKLEGTELGEVLGS